MVSTKDGTQQRINGGDKMEKQIQVKIVVDRGEFLRVYEEVSPLSAKLFFYMACKHPDGGPFRMTHATMIKECNIAAPARGVSELVGKGYLTRRHVGRHENEYQIPEKHRIIKTIV